MSSGRQIGIALCATLLAGCYQDHPCEGPELCNYRDDDCNGRVDETFRDEAFEDPVYASPENCGGCGVVCDDVFPTALTTECVVSVTIEGPEARCEIATCPDGFHITGDSACVPDVPVLCLPCSEDSDCEIRDPRAACVSADDESTRCALDCSVSCPDGTECSEDACLPPRRDCDCTDENVGLVFGCLINVDSDHACAGVQTCTETGLTACEGALAETCNEQDDDCDGSMDEDFRDDNGVYVARLHCGGCGLPCVEPGPNMVAECAADTGAALCEVACAEGFVDVDGILANGCECERFDGTGPPPVVGGDSDCDGVPDDDVDFVFVTTTGSDANAGSLLEPMRTIAAALLRGRDTGLSVLVARGVYDGPFDLVAGVDVYGGYRPDFRDRDLELYPVFVERSDGAPGLPVLTCADIAVPTEVEGFTLSGSDAVTDGSGSTVVYLDGCSEAVTLSSLTVLAGRGADGARGDDSSDNLSDLGLPSLSKLDGTSGGGGLPSSDDGCIPLSGGSGGIKMCPSVDVSGGGGGAAACPATGCTNGSPCANAGCTDFTGPDGTCDIDAVLSLAVANPAPEGGSGAGGGSAGELTYNAPTNRGVCNFCDDNPTLGRSGADGIDGESGADGSGGGGCDGDLTLDGASGTLSGGAGTSGAAGTDGSGGGGASAGSGYAVIAGTAPGCTDRSGGSGGGGGSGGCGAPQADGGSGAGASVGIAIRLDSGANAGPTLRDVRVVTDSGGAGGDGGIGANGGAPGVGGLGGAVAFWCSRSGGRGGDGGRGGAGGGGGGGCGGGSHAIVLAGGAEVAAYVAALGELTFDFTGVPGPGGVGGFSPGDSGSDGAFGGDDPILVLP